MDYFKSIAEVKEISDRLEKMSELERKLFFSALLGYVVGEKGRGNEGAAHAIQNAFKMSEEKWGRQ